MESIILNKLKRISAALFEIENENLNDYDTLLEWKLLKAQSNLLWEILDEVDANNPNMFDSDEETKEWTEANEIIDYIKADI